MGYLMCTGREWCDFIVWTFKGIVVVHNKHDNHFIEKLQMKLTGSFDNFFKQVLLEKYLYKGSDKYLTTRERV
ncbi:hypothetical protein LSH36_191g02057 [Paralvinella palmiformis]|uniref:Uncharacterized protein n=1 Tax=Paralvinella palmiformis TaxID=53620 RepID=A0AAD9JR81_9ANNE|nr:hypothetical protein LSH36_191g02057 [Paralvinella palmiformis]